MLKQGLQQTMQQKLSPLQIQMIKMIESTTMEMEERIQQELDDNPALEEAEGGDTRREELPDENRGMDDGAGMDDDADYSMSDYRTDDTPSYKLSANNYADEERRDAPITESASLHEFLVDQLHLQNVTAEEAQNAEFVIGNVEHDGYVRRTPREMANDVTFQTGRRVMEDDMKKALALVQTLEPAGVGAPDLQTCLVLQLQRKKPTIEIKNAIAILQNNFEDFSKKHYEKIMRKYALEEEDLRGVIAEIVKLNPKPGSSWDNSISSTSVQIVPDFMVEEENGELILSLNDRNIPELRISQEFADQLDELSRNRKNQSEDSRNAALFIKQKVDSAKWFINSIKQRQETLRSTMQAIVNKQRDFFLTGDETRLKPMVLKDVAQVTGYDISTISRVSNSKYVLTDWGVYPLKFFFSESMATDSGEEVSNTEIKKILQDCIGNEDKRNPLTDDRLSEILQSKGYVIARRTVAKYRKQLGIPVATLRKEI